jgi:hypothetical protein
LTWWLVFDIVGWWLLTLLAGYWYCWLAKTSLLTSELEPLELMKVVGNCLSFPTKNK